MNTNQNVNQIGAAGETVAVIQKQRGRPRSATCLRQIRLDADNKPVSRGAPKVGSEIKVAVVQRAVKNSEFVYGKTPAEIKTIVIGARQPRKPKVVVQVQPALNGGADIDAPIPVINVGAEVLA
jgi:hypothetical protein